MSSARVLGSLLVLLCWGAASPVWAANRYDSRLRFRTIRTAHFDVHAHQGEEAMARRLAAIVERVRKRFAPVMGVPRGRVQVILVDQTDVSNGWATPAPYNTIEITAVAPSSETLIGNATDWLELVFTHEYTHILHLDRTRGWLMQGVRRVFGRVPVAFPNAFLPAWQIEGLATFEESRMTGEGRIHAGDFRAIVDVAASTRQFEPIDRAGGGLDDWPGGHAPYAYGAYFHQFLADTYGPDTLARLADETSGRVPLFGGGAFKQVFGRSAGDLWDDFRRSRERAAVSSGATDARARRLTRHGFTVTAPRVADSGAIYYALADADGFPALMELPPGGAPRRIAWRAYGNRTSVRGDWIVFDQLERARSVALYSDLYAVRAGGGPVRRLTRNARAGDPDLSPDARRIVCTVQATGRRALAVLDFSPGSGLSTPRLLVEDPDADYMGPRWSPDGRQLVAERRRPGLHELVIIDAGTRAVRTLAARRDARLVTPSWTPDGATILFSADVGDGPFNVFAVEAAGGDLRQVTDTAGGAQFPELSPNGTLTYVGYTPGGRDLFSVPVELFRLKAEATSGGWRADATSGGWKADATSGGWKADAPSGGWRADATSGGWKADATSGWRADATSGGSEADATGAEWRADATRAGSSPEATPEGSSAEATKSAPGEAPGNSRGFRLQAEDPKADDPRDEKYRPGRTLLPTFWTPIVVSDGGEIVAGAATAMFDALGRHAYAVDAGWSGARTRPDWHAAYAYDRWRPTLFASYSDDTDPITGGTVRSRELLAGVLLPFRRLRWTETLLAGFDAQTDTLACAAVSRECRTPTGRRDRRSVRAGWLHDSRRLFGYSIGPEEGFAVEVAAEASRRAFGSDLDAGATVLDVRGYRRVFGRHTILAGRVGAAAGWGPLGARRLFSAGGAGPSQPVFDFGRDRIGLLRGFAPEDLVGSRAAVANLDLRVPLARVQRGAGTWPIFFRTLHAAAFVDAGHAWDSGFRAADLRTSTGVEVSLDLVVFHYLPLTLASGAAWTRDPVADRSHAAFFGRIGYAF